jgi:hypothetical protein
VELHGKSSVRSEVFVETFNISSPRSSVRSGISNVSNINGLEQILLVLIDPKSVKEFDVLFTKWLPE